MNLPSQAMIEDELDIRVRVFEDKTHRRPSIIVLSHDVYYKLLHGYTNYSVVHAYEKVNISDGTSYKGTCIAVTDKTNTIEVY